MTHDPKTCKQCEHEHEMMREQFRKAMFDTRVREYQPVVLPPRIYDAARKQGLLE